MIHSMAGGVVRENKRFDFAKVRLDDGSVRFYISKIANLQAGDHVLVPADSSFGFEKNMFETAQTMHAVVLRVDKNVSEQVAPVPVKRCKEILKKVEEN